MARTKHVGAGRKRPATAFGNQTSGRGKKGSIRRLLMIGWDGADPDLIEKLCAQGRLPNLQSLKERGVWGRLSSTYPPSSLPAWTSALTGVGPGEHGLLNYIRRDPNGYQLRLVDARERVAVNLPTLTSRAGMKVASLGVPGSYPPDPQAGLCIAGFDSPFAMRACRQAYQPPGLFEMLKSRGLSWPYGDMDEYAVGSGWHLRARKAMLSTMQEKLRIAEFLLKQRDPFDLFLMVFSETDTAGHHFWAFYDRHSPRHRNVPELAEAIEEVYCGLDHCLGVMLDYLDEQATVIVLSDHGFGGASDTVFCINRWLNSQGYLRFKPQRSRFVRAAGLLRDVGIRYLPPSLKQLVLRGPLSGLVMQTDALCRFGGLDFHNTRAFSDELPQNPGIWIHLRGRDPLGIVEPGDEYEGLRQEIIDRLQDACAPDSGHALVSRVFRREEVVPGPFMDRAPDLLVELASLDGYRLLSEQSNGRQGVMLRKLSELEKIGSKGIGISGVHRSDGMLVIAGSCKQGTTKSICVKIEDIFTIMVSVLGLKVPQKYGGKTKEVDRQGGILKPEEKAISDLESASVRKRLENLGYL